MTISTRTRIASLLRQHAQGMISAADLYHMIGDLYAAGDGAK